MKKSISLLSVLLIAASSFALTACDKGGDGTTTADIVAKASKMSLSELENASKAEMEASSDTFKVVGLTSTLTKALTKFCDKYEWVTEDNTYCNNSYKDYALLTALEAAEDSYFADFALVQDARSLADYLEVGITHNFVPSDYASLGLAEKDTYPLKGIHFNKILYTNTSFESNTGKTLHNVWQLAGSEEDTDHLSNFSFQSPVTEQINMSFLLSLYSEDNQAKLATAYKSYYGKDWASEDYTSIAEEYVTELIANVSKWHSSDGTAMKETQVKDTVGYVYYGAFAKMKDAAGKDYDLDGDGTAETNAMTTVDWALDIEGFNGFMYCMYSQIVNNAKHPYTACLYARYLLEPECYQAMCYNSSTPNKAGESANMYGYYYPCASTTVGINDNDWSKEEWINKSVYEDYDFLKDVKIAQVNTILALVNSNTKA